MMSLTEREWATRESYNKNCEKWLEHSGGRDRPCYWEKEVSDFLSYLGSGKEVLEVGCGPATDGKYLLERGCSKVISVDYSESMLKMARDIHRASPVRSDLLTMDVYKLGLPNDCLDGFWASASLLHLEKPQKALSEIGRVIKGKGIGFISVKEGDGEEFDEKKNYLFVYYNERSFKKILKKSGMETIDFSKKAGYSGHDWLNFIVRVYK